MAAKSSIDDVVAVVGDVAHMERGQLEEASGEGTVAAAAHNTFVDSAVIAKGAARTSYVGRVQRERLQKLGSSTVGCDMRSGDKEVATFVRLP